MSDGIKVKAVKADSAEAELYESIKKLMKGTPMGARMELLEAMERVCRSMILCTVVAYGRLKELPVLQKEMLEEAGSYAAGKVDEWDFTNDCAKALIKDVMFKTRDLTEAYFKANPEEKDEEENDG